MICKSFSAVHRCLTALVVVLCSSSLWSAEPVGTATVRDLFEQADLDQNKRVSLEEYQKFEGDPRALNRDFRLFDFDGNNALIFQEFAAIPGRAPADQRGDLPDPFDRLLQQAVAAMDVSYDDWDKQNQKRIPVYSFAANFVSSLIPSQTASGRPASPPSWMINEIRKSADTDSDSMITRDEAERFLQVQLGIIRQDGRKLRTGNGRVIQYSRYFHADTDRDSRLSKAEFLAAWDSDNLEAAFLAGDRNKDGKITLDEFFHPDGIGYDDPVARFLQGDQDFDGLCTQEELKTVTSPDQQVLLPLIFAGLDHDQDGKITLDEFRISPLGNRVSGMEAPAVDSDRDRCLTVGELRYRGLTSHLLHRLYLHQLDRNQDGFLTEDEFPIQFKEADKVYVLSEDGNELRMIYTNPDFPSCGSPAVSNDGKRILFDTWKGGETFAVGRVFEMPIAGGTAKNLCAGLMPSWSPDNKQFACCRNAEGDQNNYGIWIMNADGTPFHKIAPAWGAQWSPDGKTIAFTTNGGISTYDVATREIKQVLARNEQGIEYAQYNMSWSPDSSRLAFHGQKDGASVVVSIAMNQSTPDPVIHLKCPFPISNDVAWSNDGKRILFLMPPEKGVTYRLHEVDAISDAIPRRVKGIPDDWMPTAVCRIPEDQGFLVFIRQQ